MSTDRERSPVGHFIARVERVARLFARAAKDGSAESKLRVVAVIAVSFIGASAQAGTIAALNFFVKGIESEVPTSAPLFGFPVQNDMRTLALLASVVLFLQLLNALSMYYVAITSRAIGRAFHVRSTERIFEAFSRSPYLRTGLADPRAEVVSSVSRCPRIMGVVIEQLVGTLQAGCYVVGYVVVLIKISVEISLLTLPVFLVVLPFLYRLSTQTQKAAKAFYGTARKESTRYARRQLHASDQTNVHLDFYGATKKQQFHDSEEVRAFLDVFDDIRLTQRRSVLITSLFRGFLLFLILAVLGFFSIRGSYSWGELLVYVLALWQLVNQVQGVTNNLMSLNRFEPPLVDYYAVQDALVENTTDSREPSLDGPLVIESSGRIPGDAGRLEVTRGDRIVYLTEVPLCRMEFAEVLAPLLAACSGQKRILRAASFCSGADVSPLLPLYAMVLGRGAPSADELADLEARLADLGLAQELAALPEGSSAFLSEGTWDAMSLKLRAALRILSLVYSPSELCFVDWSLVGSVEKDFAMCLLALLDDRIAFVVSSDGRTECEWARGFVVSENGEVVGVGDALWWDAILEYRRKRVPSEQGPAGSEDERIDDEEDM